MEAWTPEGDLLVSEPGSGRVVQLTPQSGGTAASHILLSGLTSPQGLAFARLAGRWVLYVGESDQIDRYPWGPGGISGTRTVIAAHLPDLGPAGDDVHRAKDVAPVPRRYAVTGCGGSPAVMVRVRWFWVKPVRAATVPLVVPG
jgi:hypothetical protein